MQDYTPVPKFEYTDVNGKRIKLIDAITAMFRLGKAGNSKLAYKEEMFFFFNDPKNIYFPTQKMVIPRSYGNVVEVEAATANLIFAYYGELKDTVRSYLEIDVQLKKYDYQNKLMNPGKGDSELRKTVLYQIREQYFYFTEKIIEFCLTLTHIFYYKDDGRDLEVRPGKIVEKCFVKALELVKPIMSSFDKELVTEYGNILDGIYHIEKAKNMA